MDTYRAAALRIENTLDHFQNINKTLLFAGLSGLAAFIGSFVGLYLNPLSPGFFHLLVWDAVLCFSIGSTVAVVQNWSLGRLPVAHKDLLRAALYSAAGGAIAGFALFATKTLLGLPFHFFGFTLIPHVAAWTAEGLVMALAVSRAIPNLPIRSAVLAGAGAGMLGGLFTHSSLLHVTLADALKGVFIAFSLSVVEKLAREAWLVVKRAQAPAAASRGLTLLATPPTLSLGETPILIGTSPECQVVLPEGEPVRGEVTFAKGLVTFHDRVENSSRSLTHGQTLRFGELTLEVGMRAESSGADGGQ